MTFKTENRKIFDVLFETAKSSEFEQHRHASAITYKNTLLAVGINKAKSHPLQKRFSESDDRIQLHSEIDTIVQVINNHGADILKECSLYNLRLTKGGNIGISKPCDSCQRAIEVFGIERVYWT